MLERGSTVFDCQVDKLLLENEVYHCYLLVCSDSALVKLFLLNPDQQRDQKPQQAFFDHVERLSNQSFPKVASPIKAEEIDGCPACLYPLVSGTPLVKILDDGCSVRQAVQLIKAIAECLSAPHAADLCHGHLSPETIYVDGVTPCLADFSLSQLIRMDYKSGINPQYTSPEQVRGEISDKASDLYSLGCVFYHLLAGRPPFSGEDAFSIAKQHLQGEFPRLPEELGLFQPLLDLLTKTEAEERVSIDEFVNQISLLSAHQKIDQIQVPSSAEDDQVDEISSTDEVTLLDETVDGSEIAARIEARLNAHVDSVQKVEPDMPENEQPCDGTGGLDYTLQKEKTGFWRFILILLLGIFIGSALYFLFYPHPSVAPPVVVESTAAVDNQLTGDLDKGLKLWQEGDFNGAEEEFKKIISRHEDDPRAYNNLAAFYAAQGNYDQAREYLERALATDEEYATIYHNLGSVYAEMARGAYGRALRLDQGQAVLALPVFSSQGVSSIDLNHGEVVTQQETVPEEEVASIKSPKPKVLPTAAESTPVAASSTSEPGQSQAAEGEGQTAVVSPEESTAPAIEEPLVDSESSQDEPAVTVPEKGDHFLRRWAEAWSNQDVASYLTFYSDQFTPPGGRTRKAWEAQRRSRLTKPESIKVSLENFKITPQANGDLRVEVIQTYTSNLLTDRTQKVFELQPDGTSWKILRERSLGVIR